MVLQGGFYSDAVECWPVMWMARVRPVTIGTETVHQQDSSPTHILETVLRQNWRQFADTFKDSSPTKKYCFMGFNEENKRVVLK